MSAIVRLFYYVRFDEPNMPAEWREMPVERVTAQRVVIVDQDWEPARRLHLSRAELETVGRTYSNKDGRCFFTTEGRRIREELWAEERRESLAFHARRLARENGGRPALRVVGSK